MSKPLSEVLVRDVMSTRLVTVPADTTILQVAKMMEQGGIGAVFVKQDKIPVSIITDRDYAIRVTVNECAPDTRVDKIASSPLITVDSDEGIAEAAAIMKRKKIRKLAVIEGGKIVGIITSTNIVNQVAAEQDQIR